MTRTIFFPLIFICLSAWGDSRIEWKAPVEDVLGQTIDDSRPLVYRVYYTKDGGDENFKLAKSVGDLFVDVTNASNGCYNVYVTAGFINDPVGGESEPSNTIYFCLESGDVIDSEGNPVSVSLPVPPVIEYIQE